LAFIIPRSQIFFGNDQYLNSIKKPPELDPSHKSIGTYNGRQMVF
jgi:hypothetical protein